MSGVGLAYLGVAAQSVQRFARQARSVPSARPPITVLKPLCGEDIGLYDNLLSFCRQDYPTFQIVFGVRDADDLAIAVVRRLMSDLPEADLALVLDPNVSCANLKVANLINMMREARHDVLVIADSDMRVERDYLAEVTAPLQEPSVGLVTCLYRGVPAGGIWSRLACLHVNHGFLPQALVGERLNPGEGCFGASMALKRSTLDAIGGLAAVADDLADDYELGAAVRRLGLKVVVSPHLIDNITEESNFAALWRHELRWARTIRQLAPGGYAGSVVTHPVVLAALAVAMGGLPRLSVALLAVAFFARFAMVRAVDRALKLPRTPAWLLLPRDLLSFGVFIASYFSRKVAWRNQTFHVSAKGRLTLDGDTRA